MVFVSHTHGLWKSDRKTTKRYGRIIESPESGLSDMLVHHKNDVFEWIQKRVEPSDSEESEEEKPPTQSPTKGTPRATRF